MSQSTVETTPEAPLAPQVAPPVVEPQAEGAPTETTATTEASSLRRLLVVNTALLSLLLAAVLGFGGYYVVTTLPSGGGAALVEVKVVDSGAPIKVVLVGGGTSEQLALDNPGVTKTWNLTVPYGQTVSVTMQVTGATGGAVAGACSITRDGTVLVTQSLDGSAGVASCTWTNR